MLSLILLSTSLSIHAGPTDPYQHVVLATNTVAWPYNSKTYGHDTFQIGNDENEDTKLINW